MPTKIKVRSNNTERSESEEGLALNRERSRHKDKNQRAEDIEDSLLEIYRDGQGNKIAVDRLKIKRKQGFVFWFFNFLVFGLIAIVVALGLYYYLIYGKNKDSSSLILEIDSSETVMVGEEFYYTIKYHNPEYVALKNAILKVYYPEKFIYLESSLNPSEGNDFWNLGKINARSDGELKIKGKIIDQSKSSAIILAKITYIPENFSSEFKKEASRGLTISSAGFETIFDYSNTALVGEQGEIKITFKPEEKNYLPDFIIRLEKDKNIEIKNTIVGDEKKDVEGGFKAEKIKEAEQDSWLISKLSHEDSLEIIYKIKDKISDKQDLKIFLEENISDKKYIFLEKKLSLEIIKSDLNLTLTMNDSQSDRPVNFGDRLDYSLSYTNKGEVTMKNVSLSIILESDFLDWTTLEDAKRGHERGNMITWTKTEIPALEEIAVNKSGSINFSIEVLPFKEGDVGKDFKVSTYGEYHLSLSDKSTTTTENIDNRSNTIVSRLNSDLGFRVEARYFNENNMPVGNGPLPPKVEEKTSFKIYWAVSNNLHDLSETKVETTLPEGVVWDDHNRTSVGTLSYDEASNKVIWQIGRLPITVFRADAEFNISLTPREEDRNKIMIVLSNTTISAKDSITESLIEKTSAPKTTKLEDDEIANMSSDGVVR
ncbi:MAG: hypothetical protein WC415_03930 [Patescibacteria group bacterium]